MKPTYLESHEDEVLLLARVLLSLLYIIFGWQKLVGFSGTVSYMASTGLPVPAAAAVVAIVSELGFGAAITLGLWMRLSAPWLALYTLAAALIGHRFWILHGVQQYENMIHFYKNLSIAGGALLLSLTGPGRFSLDAVMFRSHSRTTRVDDSNSPVKTESR